VPSALGANNTVRWNSTPPTSPPPAAWSKPSTTATARHAAALDGRVIRVQAPSSSDQRVAFIGTLKASKSIRPAWRPRSS
jgi:flagellar P-ring protein precursor FlgI